MVEPCERQLPHTQRNSKLTRQSYRPHFLQKAPPEVFLAVLEHLDQADLASLSLVCKGLHNIAQNLLYRHISLRNDKDALQLIRTHHLNDSSLPRHVTFQTRSLVAGSIGKVKLLTILKACSFHLKHLSINCRLLSRQDQLEICQSLASQRLDLHSIGLRDPQPDFVDCIRAAQRHSLRSLQVI